MPKKVITPEHQAKMIAGNRAAKGRRKEIKLEQDIKSEAVDAVLATKDGIDLQLESVTEDVESIRKVTVLLERAVRKQNWGMAFKVATALNSITSNVARRIEVCAAQADVVNKLATVLKNSKLLLLLLLVSCGSDGHDTPAPDTAVASVYLTVTPAPLVVVSKPAPIRYWKDLQVVTVEKEEDDDEKEQRMEPNARSARCTDDVPSAEHRGASSSAHNSAQPSSNGEGEDRSRCSVGACESAGSTRSGCGVKVSA